MIAYIFKHHTKKKNTYESNKIQFYNPNTVIGHGIYRGKGYQWDKHSLQKGERAEKVQDVDWRSWSRM